MIHARTHHSKLELSLTKCSAPRAVERAVERATVSPYLPALLAVVLLTMFVAAQPGYAQKPSSCMCSANFAMVTLSLVDAKGAPVQDATVRVRRVRTGSARDVTADLPGIYTIADDMLRDSLRAEGEPFEISVRWHRRTQRVITTIGTRAPRKSLRKASTSADSCRCHVMRIAGVERLVLR